MDNIISFICLDRINSVIPGYLITTWDFLATHNCFKYSNHLKGDTSDTEVLDSLHDESNLPYALFNISWFNVRFLLGDCLRSLADLVGCCKPCL